MSLRGARLLTTGCLWLRYGKRFAPQDMDHLEPLPSGILAPLRIVPESNDATQAQK